MRTAKSYLMSLRNLTRIVFRNPKAVHLIHLQMEPTSICNMKCIMCAREDKPYQLGKDMSMKTFMNILNTNKSLQSVMLTGLGEPFLHKNIFDMIKEIKKRGMFLEMVSNGTVINKEIAEKIVKQKVDELTISIDGVKSYKKIRGMEIYGVLKGLKNICEAKKRLKSKKPKILINTVVMHDNINDLKNLIELLTPYDVTWRLKTIRPNVRVKKAFFDNEIKKIVKTARSRDLRTVYHRFKFVPFCYRLWFSANVLWDGRMTPCCDIYNIIVGDYKSWNSKEYIEFRRNFLKGKYPPECRVCNLSFNQRAHKFLKIFTR